MNNNLELKIKCCLCGKFKDNNDWIIVNDEIKEYYHKNYKISHAYCNDCYEIELIKIKIYKQNKGG